MSLSSVSGADTLLGADGDDGKFDGLKENHLTFDCNHRCLTLNHELPRKIFYHDNTNFLIVSNNKSKINRINFHIICLCSNFLLPSMVFHDHDNYTVKFPRMKYPNKLTHYFYSTIKIQFHHDHRLIF